MQIEDDKYTRRLIIELFILFCFLAGLIFPYRIFAVDVIEDSAAVAFYRRGEVFISRGDTAAAIRCFEQGVKLDSRNGGAHHHLAQLYLGRGQLSDRIRARELLEKAIWIDPENIQYLLTQLSLELLIEYDGMARRLIRKILKLDSTVAEAHLASGLLHEKRWLKYRKMIDIKGEGTTPFDQPVIVSFHDFVERDFDRALTDFGKAAACDTSNIDAYTHQALIYFETQQTEHMVSILKDGIRKNPDAKQLHLCLGLAYHTQRRFEDALAAYEAARSRMAPGEAALFGSAEPVSTPPEAIRMQAADADRKSQLDFSFWKQRDPLFITEVNERLMEHYSRFAYANLRYSIPAIPGVRRGTPGWESDPGKVFIRYGTPKNEMTTWPTLGGIQEGLPNVVPHRGGKTPIAYSTKTWSYPGFTFTFKDYSLNQNYRFRFGVSGPDDRERYRLLIKKTPETYEYASPEQYMRIICDTGRFRGPENVSIVDVYQSLSIEDFPDGSKGTRPHLKRGLFAFDPDWKEIVRDTTTAPILLPVGETLLFGWKHMAVSPGIRHLAVEFLDEETGKVGRWQNECTVPAYDSRTLALSDPLLAWEISEPTAQLELRRGGKRILPNIYRTFPTDFDLPVYFEIYNLAFSEARQTHYRVTFTVEPADAKKGPGQLIGRIFQGRSDSGRITTSYGAQGESRFETMDQVLRIVGARAQDYRLKIRIRDLITGDTASQQKIFRLLESTAPPGRGNGLR